jgi:hypothetical protein
MLLLLFPADVTLVLCEREEVTHRSTPFLVACTANSTATEGTASEQCVKIFRDPLTCSPCCLSNLQTMNACLGVTFSPDTYACMLEHTLTQHNHKDTDTAWLSDSTAG